jgi:hypothetical protein
MVRPMTHEVWSVTVKYLFVYTQVIIRVGIEQPESYRFLI